MAFTAVIGLAAGTTAVTTVTVLAAVAEIGMALSIVGGITGNKNLSKIGGVMSLVGGVGGMVAKAATSAGAAGIAEVGGTVASKGVEAGVEGSGVLDGITSATDVGTGAMEGASSMAETGANAAGTSLSSTMPDMATAMNPTDMALASGNKMSPGLTTDAVTSVGLQAPAPAAIQAPTGVTEVANPYSNPTDMRLESGLQSSPGGAPQSSSSFFETLTKFADKNKTLLNSGMQLVGGAMKGANEQAMWQEKMALEQQRLKQTSYGNTTANFAPRGIIAGAR